MADTTGPGPAGTHRSPVVPPESPPPANHGKTAAAWTTMLLVTLGALVACVGVATGSTVLGLAGGGVVLLGLVVGRIMRAMGLGQPHTTHAGEPIEM